MVMSATITTQDSFSNIFKKCISKDPFNNCHVDLTSKGVNKEYSHPIATEIFSQLFGKEKVYDHIFVKFTPTNTDLYTYLINQDFKIHSGHPDVLLVKRCFGHQDGQCAINAKTVLPVPNKKGLYYKLRDMTTKYDDRTDKFDVFCDIIMGAYPFTKVSEISLEQVIKENLEFDYTTVIQELPDNVGGSFKKGYITRILSEGLHNKYMGDAKL